MGTLFRILCFVVGIPLCGALCFLAWWSITQCTPCLRRSIHWKKKDGTIDDEKISIGIGACCVTLTLVVILDWVIRH